jgi:nitronate monooxygenase
MALPELKIGNLSARLPIIQGGMGVGISMAGLSAAVANEGGIGVIAAAMAGIAEPDVAQNPVLADTRALSREIRKAKQNTKGILGVNIMVALTNYGDLVKSAIDAGIDIIFSGAGLPLSLPGFLNGNLNGEKSVKLVPIVSSGRAAQLICKKWLAKYDYLPDAFVVEGPKAGGHLGFKPEQIDDPGFALEKLMQDVIESIGPMASSKNKIIPVIAAGGIFSGEDIRKFLGLGAAGVQMGTRFVATNECDAADGFKQAFLAAGIDDVAVIKSPVGMPGRAIRNTFLDQVEQGIKKPFTCPFHCIKTCDRKTSPYCIALALASARKGKFKNGFAFAGSNVFKVNEIISVKSLMQKLQNEYQHLN